MPAIHSLLRLFGPPSSRLWHISLKTNQWLHLYESMSGLRLAHLIEQCCCSSPRQIKPCHSFSNASLIHWLPMGAFQHVFGFVEQSSTAYPGDHVRFQVLSSCPEAIQGTKGAVTDLETCDQTPPNSGPTEPEWVCLPMVIADYFASSRVFSRSLRNEFLLVSDNCLSLCAVGLGCA